MSLLRKRPAIILLGVVLISSCSGFLSGSDPLANSSWSAEALGNEPVLAGNAPTLNFSEGRVSGSAGCNSYQGDYSVSGERITFSDLAMTLMACPDAPAVMDQEQRFFNLLEAVNRFDLAGSQLELETSDGTVLVFESE